MKITSRQSAAKPMPAPECQAHERADGEHDATHLGHGPSVEPRVGGGEAKLHHLTLAPTPGACPLRLLDLEPDLLVFDLHGSKLGQHDRLHEAMT
jgi:hypothetical protein